MEELLSKSNYRIAIRLGTSAEDFFRYSKIPTIQNAWKTRIEPHLNKPEYSLSNEDRIQLILSDNNDNFAWYYMGLSSR